MSVRTLMPPCVCSPNVYVFSHRPVIYIQNHDNNFFQCSGNQTLLFPWCISHKNVGYIKLTSLLLQLSQFNYRRMTAISSRSAQLGTWGEKRHLLRKLPLWKRKKTVRGGYWIFRLAALCVACILTSFLSLSTLWLLKCIYKIKKTSEI